jgi:hypothetical protein
MHTVTCAYAYCETVFTAQRSTAQYCSSDCRVAAFHMRERQRADEKRWAEGEWRLCMDPDCDNVLDPGERSDKIFCSNACRQRSLSQLRPRCGPLGR